MRSLVVTLCLLASLPSVAGEAPIFPQPLHLVREIHDSISGAVQTIDEYCDGDRVVAVAGSRSVITNYQTQTVTRIDRGTGTYSVAPFHGIVRHAAAKQARTWTMRSAPPQTIADRAADVVEFESSSPDGRERVRIASTSDVRLSRAGAEVMIGARYPSRLENAEALLGALTIRSVNASATPTPMYRLPLESVTSYEVAGEKAEVRNVITQITSGRVPAELSSIPPGARQVDPPPDLGLALQEIEQPSRKR